MTTVTWEYADRRVLAALRFVDVLGRAPRGPVTIRANGLRYVRPRPGEIVITGAPGLEAYATSFTTPPATPAIGSVAVPLDLWPADPALAPRRFGLTLPRDPDPANAGTAGSLFQPIVVPLLPAPSATPPGLAAALRVVVIRSTDNARIEGALVRVRPSGGLPESRALTGPSGEAVLLVPSLPLASPGSGGTVVGDMAADLDAIVDPSLARFNALPDLDAARATALARTGPLIDPDDLESRLSGSATVARSIRIAAGETRIPSPPEIFWSPP
jgi:hypothetical protein